MEAFFNAFWTSYDAPSDWRATFFEGKITVTTSFEIVSLEGVPHFYIRTPEMTRPLLESTLYAQYPDVELVEVPDYVATVPQDIPNKDWDLWGCDFAMTKPYVYPIKTYSEFWEEKPDMPDEIKRLDPLSNILELFSSIGKGEYMWFQLNAQPVAPDPKEVDFKKAAQREIDLLMKRVKPDDKKKNSFWDEFIMGIWNAFWWLVLPEWIRPGTMTAKKEEKKEELFPGAMLLSPGEKDVIAAIERKASKISYRCGLRYMYVGRRDVFNSSAKAYGPSFTAQFGSHSTNSLKPFKTTITKIQQPDILRQSRLFIRKRDLFWKYRDRDIVSAVPTVLLNSEELATIYHFPGFEVAPVPALGRIGVKKVAPPTTLPVE
jgi:hypothetical protein